MTLRPYNTVLPNHRPIVLFSKNYLPMARINLKRATVLLVTGRAEPLDLMGNTWQMRSPSFIVAIPEHIRLRAGDSERLWKTPPVNRREVLRRDGHTCQYCGSKRQLTLDHVVPRSQGGAHTWNNVVTACAPCNSRKGACTPDVARMPLRRRPKAPMHPVVAFAEKFWKEQTS